MVWYIQISHRESFAQENELKIQIVCIQVSNVVHRVDGEMSELKTLKKFHSLETTPSRVHIHMVQFMQSLNLYMFYQNTGFFRRLGSATL